MQNPPRLIATSDNPEFSAEVRVLGWKEMRRIARQAGCNLTEERVGWITMKFVVTGTPAQLQQFVDIIWWSPELGEQFQKLMGPLS